MSDVHHDSREPRSARLFLNAGRLLIFIPIVLTAILMSAGTFLSPECHRPAVMGLGLKSLAMVSFDGIIASNTTSPGAPNYLFTLHKFPNAFSWECPDCPAFKYFPDGRVALAGVLQTGPAASDFDPLDPMLRLMDDIAGSGRGAISDCFRKGTRYSRPHHSSDSSRSPSVATANGALDDPRGRRCSQDTPYYDFFNAWRKTYIFPLVRIGIPMSFIIYVMSALLSVMALANELLIAYRPGAMRCRCICMKSWCPYPKGTAEEIAKLPPHVFDRVRLSVYGLTAAYFGLLAFHETVFPGFWISHLRFVDRYLPEGMSMRPRRNGAYQVLLWTCVVVCVVAMLCAVARWMITRPRVHISLDDLPPPAQPPRPRSGDTAAELVSGFGDGDDDAPESQRLLPPPYSVVEGK